MNRVGEQYTMRISRYDLSPEQFYLEKGDRVLVAIEGFLYLIEAARITPADAEEDTITITGTLHPAEEDDYSRGHLETSDFGILSKS